MLRSALITLALFSVLVSAPIPMKVKAGGLPDWVRFVSGALNGEEKDINCLGWFDLRGEGGRISLRPEVSDDCMRSASHKTAALFIVWNDGQGNRFMSAMVDGKAGARSVWQWQIDGPWFRIINDVGLIRVDGDDWVRITLHQTVIPKPPASGLGEKPRSFRPGPPLKRSFIYDEVGEKYQRITS